VGWMLTSGRRNAPSMLVVGNGVVRFRLTVSLLRCRDGSVEIFLWRPLLLSVVQFLSCGLRLLAAAVGLSMWRSKVRSFGGLLLARLTGTDNHW
jgi:hypothetical protein